MRVSCVTSSPAPLPGNGPDSINQGVNVDVLEALFLPAEPPQEKAGNGALKEVENVSESTIYSHFYRKPRKASRSKTRIPRV